MRSRAFYRGERKYSWIITLALFVLVVLIFLSIWLFYYLQKFIVYDKDGLKLVFPSELSQQAPSDETGSAVPLPSVDVEIVVDKTDYSGLVTSAGEDLVPLHAVRIEADKMSQSTLDFYLADSGKFNAIVMELKPASGFLSYHSTIPLADSYGINGALELQDSLAKLKEKDLYLVAEISCLVDETMALRNSPIALKNSISGEVFRTADGSMWLDPFALAARDYISSLMQEAYDLGFDEVLLSGMYCPSGETVQFSQAMTQTPDLCSAVNAMGLALRRSAEDIGIKLSVKMESLPLARGSSAEIGQEAEVFFRIFDRIAFDVAYTEFSAQLGALESCFPAGSSRIIPIGDGYTPDYADYIVK